MKTRPSLFRIAAVAALLVLAGTGIQATTLLKNQSLDELVAEAERSLLATVVSVEYAYDEHRIPSTFVTLQVEEAIFGEGYPDPGERFRIKLVGVRVPMEDGRRFFITGTPHYRIGERYLLLLKGESEMGFTNTAGLPTGAFRLSRSSSGQAVVQSLAGNRIAFGKDGIATWLKEADGVSRQYATTPDTPVPYSLLRQAVKDQRLAQGGALRSAP